jgi:hypothetical protein
MGARRRDANAVLVPLRAIVRSQTLFSDLNRYARPTSKSTSLLFTHREKLEFLIEHSLGPQRYRLNGHIDWQGDEPEDRGSKLGAQYGVRSQVQTPLIAMTKVEIVARL